MSACPTLPDTARPLLDRVANGDELAMTQLMRNYTPLVRSIARRTGVETADDLVQETMLRLWRSAHRYDAGRGHEATFVATVARNAAIDLARRRARRPAVTVAEPAELAPSVEPDTEHVPTTMLVRAALARLPAPQRELLRLAYYEHLSQPEIAERTGLPLGTVKSRTFQALKTLRAIMHETA